MIDINDSLVYITCSFAKQLGDVLNEKLKEYGISKVQWYALYYLGFNDKLSVCELANKMQVKHSSATRLLSRMQKDGYIVRIKDETDKRITYLRLTDSAIKIRKEVLPMWEEINKIAAKNISAAEIDSYKDFLNKISTNVIEY